MTEGLLAQLSAVVAPAAVAGDLAAMIAKLDDHRRKLVDSIAALDAVIAVL